MCKQLLEIKRRYKNTPSKLILAFKEILKVLFFGKHLWFAYLNQLTVQNASHSKQEQILSSAFEGNVMSETCIRCKFNWGCNLNYAITVSKKYSHGVCNDSRPKYTHSGY